MGENLSAYLEIHNKELVGWLSLSEVSWLGTFGINNGPLGHPAAGCSTGPRPSVGRRCRVSVLCHQHAALDSSGCQRKRKRWGSQCERTCLRKLQALFQSLSHTQLTLRTGLPFHAAPPLPRLTLSAPHRISQRAGSLV